MHSSGPRPKLQSGSPTMKSSPTLDGAAQLRFPVPALELPVGWQTTASCCPFGLLAAVLPLLKVTTRLPSGITTGSEPWLKSHACGFCAGSNKLPKKQSVSEMPLISCGVDQVTAWSVDIEP